MGVGEAQPGGFTVIKSVRPPICGGGSYIVALFGTY
jgi:hypothetical protein